jgi:hypothetical protein
MLPKFDRNTKFLVLVGFLVISMASLRYMPLQQPLGLDLHNVVVYQKCATHRSPYLIDGRTCGDVYGRYMSYPPLLFHSFRWLRPLTLHEALRIWTRVSVLAMGLVLYIWARWMAPRVADRSWETLIFGGLMLFQYPFVFEIERGQTDVVPVVLFTVGALWFTRKKYALSGAMVGLATAYKLYPVFACIVVTIGLFLAWLKSDRRGAANWLRFGASAVGGFVAANLPFLSDAKLYFLKVLPGVSRAYIPATDWVYAHSYSSLAGPQYAAFSWAICAGFVALWGWAAGQAILRDDAPLALAGGLAISTYFSAFAFDYALVTTYPLLMLLFLRARVTDRWGVFALGLFAIFGEHQIFSDPKADFLNPTTHVMVQLAFLAVAAVAVARPAPATATDQCRAGAG